MFERNGSFLSLSAIIDTMLLCQSAHRTIFGGSILVKLDMMSGHRWKLRAERAPVKSPLCISPSWMPKDPSMYRIGPLSLKKYKLKKLCSFSFYIYQSLCILQLTFLIQCFLHCTVVFSANSNPVFLVISLQRIKIISLPLRSIHLYVLC